MNFTYTHRLKFVVDNRAEGGNLEADLKSYGLKLKDLGTVMSGLHYMGEQSDVYVFSGEGGVYHLGTDDTYDSDEAMYRVTYGPIVWHVETERAWTQKDPLPGFTAFEK